MVGSGGGVRVAVPGYMEYIEYAELVIVVLISVAILTLMERQLMGVLQRRMGPSHVGYLGILQPIADGLKLVVKGNIVVMDSYNKLITIMSPVYSFTLSLLLWTLLPTGVGHTPHQEYENDFLSFILLSSLALYSFLYSGWSTNSTYGLLGSIRALALFISYEIFIGLIFLSILVLNKSLGFIHLIYANIHVSLALPLLPLTFLFFIAILAETNRTPFDLVESESELVAGHLVEFSSLPFAFFYLSEYSHILLYSHLFSLFFFPAHLSLLVTSLIAYLFIIIRASLPRLRFDQLLFISWKYFLSFSFSFFFLLLSLFARITPPPPPPHPLWRPSPHPKPMRPPGPPGGISSLRVKQFIVNE